VTQSEPKPPRILLVNYHQDTNRAMERLLRMSGFEPSTAGTLAEAEQVLAVKPIDLMVCRIAASDGDGAAFIERVWSERGVASVALAGSLENQARAARLSPGAMRGIIPMPAELKAMIATLRAALSRRGRPGVCPDCKGQGAVLLLTTTRPCLTCNGTGVKHGVC
jgi:DNA-binding response OmpR family regulator